MSLSKNLPVKTPRRLSLLYTGADTMFLFALDPKTTFYEPMHGKMERMADMRGMYVLEYGDLIHIGTPKARRKRKAKS